MAQGQHEKEKDGAHEDNTNCAKELTGLQFSLTKAIDKNDNDSNSDENNSSSDKKDKKHAAKKNGDSNSNHLDSEESKNSESSDPGDKEEGNKETRSGIEECLQSHGPGNHCQCVA